MVFPGYQRLGCPVVSAILVLWDIDHTLIENHGVNKETYALAFKLLTGCEAEHRARTDGRTEPQIMRDMLVRHGITPTADHVAGMPEVLESATLANAGVLRERGHELPGARDMLAAFRAPAGIIWHRPRTCGLPLLPEVAQEPVAELQRRRAGIRVAGGGRVRCGRGAGCVPVQ